jgi:hypothetical protein
MLPESVLRLPLGYDQSDGRSTENTQRSGRPARVAVMPLNGGRIALGI